MGTLVYVLLCHFARVGVTFRVSDGCLLLEGDLYNGLPDNKPYLCVTISSLQILLPHTIVNTPLSFLWPDSEERRFMSGMRLSVWR